MPDPEPPANQLRLDLSDIERSSRTVETSTVRSFVDSLTLAVRREAIERVKARGIFEINDSKKV